MTELNLLLYLQNMQVLTVKPKYCDQLDYITVYDQIVNCCIWKSEIWIITNSKTENESIHALVILFLDFTVYKTTATPRNVFL